MKSADGRFQYTDLNYEPVPAGTTPENVHRFEYRCRKNPKQWCSLNLRGRGHDIPERSWVWDGNVEQPTISPSINCGGCWHGFIEEGVYKNATKQVEPVQ